MNKDTEESARCKDIKGKESKIQETESESCQENTHVHLNFPVLCDF